MYFNPQNLKKCKKYDSVEILQLFIENLYSPENGRNNNELTNSTNKQQ